MHRHYDARAEVMWAGSLAHNGLTGCGNDGGDWMTHKLHAKINLVRFNGMYRIVSRNDESNITYILGEIDSNSKSNNVSGLFDIIFELAGGCLQKNR